MRPIYLAIAVVLLVAAPSFAGPAEPAMPGIGTFSYNGSPVVASTVVGSMPARLASIEVIR